MKDFKKKVKEKIALYSKKEYLDGYIRNEFLTDDNDADVYLKLKNTDELFDSRTFGKQIDLTSNVYEFIEEKSSMLESDILIDLHIVGLDLTHHEQGVVRHILKEHYAIELYKIQKEYLKTKQKIFILILVGLLSLLIYAYLFFFTSFEFGLGIFTFLFSFSLWEGFDAMIYAFNDIKRERENITQNLLMNVVFDEELNNDKV